MSYKLVDLCFDIPGLVGSEHLVLSAICRYADNATHECYPSREVISEASRLKVRQVGRVLSSLVAKGLITYVAGKGRKRNSYTVQVELIRGLIRSGDITPHKAKRRKTVVRTLRPHRLHPL